MSVIDKILDVIFPTPRICIFCGAKIDEIGMCSDCKNELDKYCQNLGICKKCHTFGYNLNSCRCCEDWQKDVRNYCVLPYVDKYRQAILDFKFNNKPYYAKAFANILNVENNNFDLVVSVPVSKKRLYERGYNQSELLAREIAKMMNVKYSNKVLVKIKDTKAQSSLNRENRLINLQGAFAIKKAKLIENKNILLVDDIITTGTTLHLCCNLLLKNNALSVKCVTIAAGINKNVYL